MGRGVFADAPIRRGEIIEVCPVIPLTKSDEEKLGQTILDYYMFAWGREQQAACIALGFGGLYNHSSSPNAVVYEVTSESRIEFVALRDIEPGQQIFIDYQWEESEYHFPRVEG